MSNYPHKRDDDDYDDDAYGYDDDEELLTKAEIAEIEESLKNAKPGDLEIIKRKALINNHIIIF